MGGDSWDGAHQGRLVYVHPGEFGQQSDTLREISAQLVAAEKPYPPMTLECLVLGGDGLGNGEPTGRSNLSIFRSSQGSPLADY